MEACQYAKIDFRVCSFIEKIDSELTLEKFNSSVALYTKVFSYSLETGGACGWTALSQAIKCGNENIANQILKKDDSSLVHLRTTSDITPIYCTAMCPKVDVACKLACILLQKGARDDLNISVFIKDRSFATTPLWESLEVTNNIALAKLLLFHGAICPQPEILSAKGASSLEAARRDLASDVSKINLMLLCLPKFLIADVARGIASIYLSLMGVTHRH